ncbi:MAG: transglycosylase SLT domain-containing protein, partial [Oscillibacter sp.]
ILVVMCAVLCQFEEQTQAQAQEQTNRQTVAQADTIKFAVTSLVEPSSTVEPSVSPEPYVVQEQPTSSAVPLEPRLQDALKSACDESGVPYTLMLGVMEVETNFQNIVGDDGESAGYLQVQEKWHRERMERLGVTDLTEPVGNFRVACDFMGELLLQYGTTDALTFYNSGHAGESGYSRKVIAAMERWDAAI